MAPPAGALRGNASRRRDAIRSTGSTTLGGGISKRRGTAGVDRDGDVSMDAPAGRSANDRGGRGNRGGRGSRGSSRIVNNVRTYVENDGIDDRPTKGRFHRQVLKVHGLKDSKASSNPDGGLRSLTEFIERKASKDRQVKIGKRAIIGDCLWITVSKDDAPSVLRLNGYSYAGTTLTITETDERMPHAGAVAAASAETVKRSKEANELRQQLKDVLARRYNTDDSLLDLSALGSDPILSNMGTFQSESTAMKAFRALLVIVSDTYKNDSDKEQSIQAVSVANNSIEDVSTIFQLALELPGLKRLDLSNNKLDSIAKLAKWKGQFRYLEELHLTGNGVVNQENYVAELLKWFPYLQILNGQQVRTPQEIDAYVNARSANPLPLHTPTNIRDVANITETFTQDFFPLYDKDREVLAKKYYDEDSVFSISTAVAPRPTNAWDAYVKHSRNLDSKATRFNHRAVITKRLYTGANLIAELFQSLPATQHFAPNSGRWIVDSHLLPYIPDPTNPGGEGTNGMMLTFNSEFEEADVSQNLFGTRGFSRTFILGPAKVVTPSDMPYRIISDQLTLHSWKASEPSTAAVAPATVVPPAPVVAAPVIAVDTMDPQAKAQLTTMLSERTGMTLEYSELCLSGAPNWNFEAAIAAFEQQKGVLPPEAFLTPQPAA